jgi:iron complex outermembrane receptor protein
MNRKTLLALCSACLLAVSPLPAQPAATGTITGRIFNPNTGEYLRNAQVRVEETGQTAISENGGEFRLGAVPAGKVTLTVTYTGYRAQTATVDVASGTTATRDFNLVSSLQAATDTGDLIKLGQFVVSSEREGNAKAIMEQRNSMNITSNVASDTFGDNAEGNIGEFLKHLPGVELDLFYGEVRNVRLGGLGSEYTSVTMDGIALASTDANNGPAGNARAFTMEMASLNSMESIEISKTISADVDANAPAGTINLKTKRAFDRSGRRVSWQANLAAHSEEFHFSQTRGPDEDRRSYKFRPGGIFEYSDVFLNRRLGVILNISESNVYQETLFTQMAYNATPTTADTRPLVLNTINFEHAPRTNKRFGITTTTDFKVSSRLSLSLGLVYNYADLWTPQRRVIFNTGGRSVVGTNPLVSFTTTSAGNVVSNPVAVSKLGETLTILPKFTYRFGNLEVEGKFAYSNSASWYNPYVRRESIFHANSPTATGITFRAERSGTAEMDWRFTQLAGPDLANGSSFSNPAIQLNDGRFSRVTLTSGEVVGTMTTNKILPIQWKAGGKVRHELRQFENDQMARLYTYAGPGIPTTGAWAPFQTPWNYDLGMNDGGITTLSGRPFFMPNLRAIQELNVQRPGDFRQAMTPTNYYEAYINQRKRYNETISAGFLMGTASVRQVVLRAGLRWEETETDSLEPHTRSLAEVRAAGFAVAAARATTIDGINFQYLSRPKVHRTGQYDNLFPSASLKYLFTRNLNFHLGYSSTIRRPTFANLAGVWIINDDTLRVNAPNPGLNPETSDNLAARLAYYFEPVGQLAVTLTEKTVDGLITADELSAQEFGNTEPEFVNYTFVSTNNSVDRVKIRGIEFEYSQSLSFLGERFKRLSVRAAYSRNYATPVRANISPHNASGGLNYSLGRLSANVNWNWQADMRTNVAFTTYRRHRTNLDAGGSWRLTNHLSLAASARNILNKPYVNMQIFGSNAAVITRSELNGISYTFAIKGTY